MPTIHRTRVRRRRVADAPKLASVAPSAGILRRRRAALFDKEAVSSSAVTRRSRPCCRGHGLCALGRGARRERCRARRPPLRSRPDHDANLALACRAAASLASRPGASSPSRPCRTGQYAGCSSSSCRGENVQGRGDALVLPVEPVALPVPHPAEDEKRNEQ